MTIEGSQKSDLAVKLTRRHPSSIVLRALLNGRPIMVGEDEYRYENGVFGVRRTLMNLGTGEKEDMIIGLEMTLEQFIKWCEGLPERVIDQTVFDLVLREKGRP